MPIEVELFAKQMQFLKCEDRFTAFIGGIGSGKTYAGCVKDMMYSVKPKSLGLVVAPTYTMLKDATLRTFLDLAGDAIESYNKSELTVKIKNGGEVLFRSADNPERLRGPNLNWAHIDEGARCPPGTWEIVIGRLRADGKAGPCWITTTPNGRNWLYQRHTEMTVFRSSTRNNPYLSGDFVSSLEKAYTGEFARQELEGEFISLEGLVYRFVSDIHVIDRDPGDFTRWGLAMDEGYTNPAVILLIGEDADGRLHIAQEFYRTGVLQSVVVDAALSYMQTHGCYTCRVDASAAGLIADLCNAGIPAEPQKGRVLDGIQVVQNMLKVQGDGRPRITVSPDCVNTINEFESYVWKEGKDEPVKENDHAMDALRYYITGLGSKTTIIENPFAGW